MKLFFRMAMLAMVMLLVAMLSAVTAMRFAIHGQEVKVPAVVGLTPLEAERAVAGLGLQVDVERQYYSPQIPEGRIMSQLPIPGTRVRRGWALRVAQSMGPQRVSIPDVTGESERAAELNIVRRGLELSSTAELPTATLPPEEVMAQSPPANASQVAAPKTSLLLSATPGPAAYVMPSFLGQGLGGASKTLQDAGFRLGNVSVAPPLANAPGAAPAAGAGSPGSAPPAPSERAPAQATPSGIIVSQTPPAGQKVFAGAVVNFEVR